jgi:hypothetical protein
MMTKDGDREKERKRQRAIGELPYPALPLPLRFPYRVYAVMVLTARIHEEWRQQMLWNSTVACTLHCAQ